MSATKEFSTFALFAAGLACLAPTVAAYRTPVGESPSGNAISEPGLDSIVPVGKPFTITWEPTTKDCSTVDLILLKGPSTDLVYVSTIVEDAENDGTYDWTPSTDLVPDVTHYGIQLICDESGVYQYTTQFGISNPDYVASSSSSSAVSSSSSAVSSSSSVVASSSSAAAEASSVAAVSSYAASTTAHSISLAKAFGTTSSATATPKYGSSNSTAIYGTGKKSASSVKTLTTSLSGATSATAASATSTSADAGSASTTTSSASASSTLSGAATHYGASIGGLVIAAGVAVFAL